jgi:integrase
LSCLPDDVREEYGRLYGARHEAKFSAPNDLTKQEAIGRYGEWLAEIEARISSIRAQRNNQGMSSTRLQTRALAGDWYHWFIKRHPSVNTQVRLDLKEILDSLYDDLSAALDHIARVSTDDYGVDKYRGRFPKFKDPDRIGTPTQLFERWAKKQKPAASTVETWRYVFRGMEEKFAGRSAASIAADEADEWIQSLVTNERSAATVDKNWLTASKTVFGWAVRHKDISRNPFANIALTIPKKRKLRERAFRTEEYQAILKAALDTSDTSTPFDAAKRWVPWICAYTGARAGEVTQLRKKDVVKCDGVRALDITPDAGTVKNREARIVPLHQDLIDQGFLYFVAEHADGPLFYSPDPSDNEDDLLARKKPRSVQMRQRLAGWVRKLGISDKGVPPNHGWRYTFQQIAARNGIEESMRDYITGHAPVTIGRSYTAPSLEDKANAMKRFPRYQLR